MDDDGLCEDGRVERVAFNERLLKTGKKGSRNRQFVEGLFFLARTDEDLLCLAGEPFFATQVRVK